MVSFDRVNHDVLMARVARPVKDERVLKLIRRYLEAGLMEGGVASARTEGTPQGRPLSPLLSNILLTDLDRELEKRRHRFCRYAVARPWQRKFLGYSMTWHRQPKLKIAPPSREGFAEKIRQTLRRARGRSLKPIIAQLNPVLRGWVAYFRLTEVKGVLEELDGWIRHKRRALLWRQWKRNHTRATNLIRRGLKQQRAWQSASNGHGPWWNGGASHMNEAYPQSWFDHMGLVSLLETQRRFSSAS